MRANLAPAYPKSGKEVSMDTTVTAIAEEAAKAMRAHGYMESSIAQSMKGF